MAVGRSVQFRGIENVVAAYERQDLAPWGIFQGTQFMQAYSGTDQKEGAELLDQYLRALDSRSADGVTYTLCVYDGLTKGEKIRSGSKYDASFNFRLIDNIDQHTSGRNYYEQRIAGLEKQLEDLSAEPEEVSAKDQFYAGLGKVLEHPQVQQLLATKLVQILDSVAGGITGMFRQPAPAAIGSAAPQDTAGENEKLQRAVSMLIEVDPQLGSHLLQLAEIAKKDPAKYNNLIGMLNLLA